MVVIKPKKSCFHSHFASKGYCYNWLLTTFFLLFGVFFCNCIAFPFPKNHNHPPHHHHRQFLLTRRIILSNVPPFLIIASMSSVSSSSSTAAAEETVGTTTSTTTTTTDTDTSTTNKPFKSINDNDTVPNRNIKWGIVGLGDVCQKKSGPAFWKANGSELVAVMRRTPGKAAEFARRVPSSSSSSFDDKSSTTTGSSSSSSSSGHCVGYDNLQEFLQHDSLDAVYVSTRPGTHLEICQQIAAKGLSCYVEKPVGRCAQETQAIIQAFEDAQKQYDNDQEEEKEEEELNNNNNQITKSKQKRKKRPKLYTAYISRAYDRTQTVRKLLREGAIGDRCEKVIYKLVGTGGARDMDDSSQQQQLPWRLDAKQSGGGLIMDVGCHVLDRIDYLCGPLENVTGRAENKNSRDRQPVEDFVSLKATIGKGSWSSSSSSSSSSPTMNFTCEGASVECTWDFASTTEEPCDELHLVGPMGSLKMAGMSPNGPIDVLDQDGKKIKEITFGMPEHTAQSLIQATTDDLRGIRSVDYLSFGDNALRTQKVLDTILDSYYGGREIGYWERVDSWPGRVDR